MTGSRRIRTANRERVLFAPSENRSVEAHRATVRAPHCRQRPEPLAGPPYRERDAIAAAISEVENGLLNVCTAPSRRAILR